MESRKRSVLCLWVGVMVVLSCSASTPVIKSSQGQILSRSRATVEKVPLGGINQTIIIRGHDSTRPILLFVHGGPGMPEGGMVRKYCPELESMFLVVDWEQRGCGLTGLEKTPLQSLSIEQLTSDLVDLTLHLTRRFHKQKVILFSHSFGTVIGLLAVRDHPELFEAYVAAGQIVNQIRAEQMGYRFCLEKAEQENNTKALKQLRALSFPENGSYNSVKYPTTYRSISAQRRWLGTYGGVTKDPQQLLPMMMACVFNKEHPFLSSLKFFKFFETSMDAVWPQVMTYDFLTDGISIEVPVYLIAGVYDRDTPIELISEYFEKLSAPKKNLFAFEHSAHLAPFEEPEKFYGIMKDIVGLQ